MSSLWREVPGAWEAVPVCADGLDLSAGGVRLVRFGEGAEGGVALLSRPGVHVRINGLPILGGLAVLQHRDEILIDTNRFCFSAQTRPAVVGFHLEAGARRPTCPVCRGAIHDDELAVRCPGCGRWYHQVEAGDGRRARTCWTYAATCRFDQHPTSLSGEAAWRPEQEEEHAGLVY